MASVVGGLTGRDPSTGAEVGGVTAVAMVAGAMASPSSPKGALSALMKDAIDNPGAWRTMGAFVESATNRKARGGISIQAIIENASGDRLVRHTVVDKAGNVIDDHFRQFIKP